MVFATVHDRYSEADIARFYAAGLWRPETLYELAEQQAAMRPGKVFATDGTTSLTYRELRDSSLRLAAGLRGTGIGPGDRVSVQIPGRDYRGAEGDRSRPGRHRRCARQRGSL